MDFNIVAVTACVSGVAHTYMAAERLEKVGHHEKMAPEGGNPGGARRRKSDHRGRYRPRRVVLLVTDIEIDDLQRFRGLRTIKTSIKSFLLQPQQIVEAVKSIMKKAGRLCRTSLTGDRPYSTSSSHFCAGVRRLAVSGVSQRRWSCCGVSARSIYNPCSTRRLLPSRLRVPPCQAWAL